MFLNLKSKESYKKIAFFPVKRGRYHSVMASTRLRAWDIIDFFKDNVYFELSFFNWWKAKQYDLVIFQKNFDQKAYQWAKKLKLDGALIVLDINVDYTVVDHKNVLQRQLDDLKQFMSLLDGLIVSSSYLFNQYSKLFDETKIYLVQENLEKNIKNSKKKENKAKTITLGWCGYSPKVTELELIRDVLLDLNKIYNYRLLLISEKEVTLDLPGVQIDFVKFNNQKIAEQLINIDIFLSPRNVEKNYNKGHTFTKVGLPMSIGVPVVAAPIESYVGSPAMLCESDEEWMKSIKGLIENDELWLKRSKAGIEFCSKHYSREAIVEQYKEVFNSLVR